MLRALDPFRFLLIAVAGWMNQHQLLVIDHLREENRILREQLGGRRLRFTDGQRRRLACNVRAAFGNAGCGRKCEFSRRREEMERLADHGNEGNPVFGPYVVACPRAQWP
jgi:hypothetical protein